MCSVTSADMFSPLAPKEWVASTNWLTGAAVAKFGSQAWLAAKETSKRRCNSSALRNLYIGVKNARNERFPQDSVNIASRSGANPQFFCGWRQGIMQSRIYIFDRFRPATLTDLALRQVYVNVVQGDGIDVNVSTRGEPRDRRR
jgi:hypothetical protein